MKRLVVGVLAHVDAGKTTLSEGLLYTCGRLRQLGRVDHKNAFLDTEALERERGITIFSKQAVLPLGDLEITLLDTPGHVDFSSEMERTLQVLDYAILVISGSDGVQSHTRTLWRLLSRYRIPTVLFINKMDLSGTDREALLRELKTGLSEGCVDFGAEQSRSTWMENIAVCEEEAMSRYLAQGELSEAEAAALVARRKVFPCYFGSALRLSGIDELVRGLTLYTQIPAYPAEFAARVFKITRDAQGNRLTHLKVTGGTLRVKMPLNGQDWEEKIDQIRVYSGAKFQPVDEAVAGSICAVTGLSQTRAGEGLGAEGASEAPALEPMLTYKVILPPGCDPHSAMQKLSTLEEEDPQLHLVWNTPLREISLQLMGEVQLEVLKSLILERFGLRVEFDSGSIVYKETIAAAVEGVGHYEPLRHYAEVHLLLEPGERGSGLHVSSACPEDQLDRSWQRLVLSHLEERIHRGVLTGAPITDLNLTLVAGRAHVKHTEGGDFRQATYRAVRQGLMSAESILLEPWYDVRLEVPAENVGRAMTDLQRMGGSCAPPEPGGELALIAGSAPVAELRDYGREVLSYTRGRGKLACFFRGYEPCRNQAAVVAAIGYDPERDLEQPADSIFCEHGAGFSVPWNRVRDYMHVESVLHLGGENQQTKASPTFSARPSVSYTGALEQDKELQAIFERTYGPAKQRELLPQKQLLRGVESSTTRESVRPIMTGPEYLLVDGYNIIFAWDELKTVARESLDTARKLLMDLLCNYQGYRKCELILVFDAYRVPRNTGEVQRYHNISVVYTKQAETADAYIEKTTYELAKQYRVRVATSDGMEQMIILGHGALRVSARLFHQEVEMVGGEIAELLAQINRKEKSHSVQAAFEKAQKKK
ncbi:translation factor GTPase family protein [Faecalispora anaeroviscerum]|uniref:translation factor GTPase family protein n=1 Tax=Faecalispora anaeroviscerum TaxID=2991836 RepID=UPI0024B9487E|nr:TetM/TetW/TetO/TetS family tetracycline resistance ribosomal protection protein [Faecalispora anaeroviscerum]